jgi:hypothetical protein
MAQPSVISPAVARTPYPCLSLARVVALVGGVLLMTAFFMPWFSSQGLLLSGQFLHQFLSNPGDLRRFLPGSSGSGSEAQLLRALVDLFPACGAVAFAAALAGGLRRGWRRLTNVALGLAGGVPLVGWAVGITRLPAGANPEIGLWLIASASLAVLVGLALDALGPPRGQGHNNLSEGEEVRTG